MIRTSSPMIAALDAERQARELNIAEYLGLPLGAVVAGSFTVEHDQPSEFGLSKVSWRQLVTDQNVPAGTHREISSLSPIGTCYLEVPTEVAQDWLS